LIAAPTAECGKTTLLEAAGELTSRPLELSSISPAAFFRLADSERPTLLIDEIQGLLGHRGNNVEFEGLLNASHRRRSAQTVRVEEEQEQGRKRRVPTKFSSWGTFAATISGRVSAAMESRCLKVMMRRARPGEVKRHLQDGTSEVLVECRRKFARWAGDQLVLPEATLPPGLANRKGDNWRPLFAIASAVGGHWPAKIKAAALAAVGKPFTLDAVVAFLTDAREIIGGRDHIFTTELIDALLGLEDPSWDWHTCYRGGPINAYWLRDKLADVLDPPGTQRFVVGGKKYRGYLAKQFDDAYGRYLQTCNLDVSDFSAPGAQEANIHTAPGASDNASGPSGCGTNKSQQTKGDDHRPDGEDAAESASGRSLDPAGLASGPIPRPTGYPLWPDLDQEQNSASGLGKILGNSAEGTPPDRIDRINGEMYQGTSTTSPNPTPKSSQPAPQPQPEGEGVDELW
jgi:hypothetical protein